MFGVPVAPLGFEPTVEGLGDIGSGGCSPGAERSVMLGSAASPSVVVSPNFFEERPFPEANEPVTVPKLPTSIFLLFRLTFISTGMVWGAGLGFRNNDIRLWGVETAAEGFSCHVTERHDLPAADSTCHCRVLPPASPVLLFET